MIHAFRKISLKGHQRGGTLTLNYNNFFFGKKIFFPYLKNDYTFPISVPLFFI